MLDERPNEMEEKVKKLRELSEKASLGGGKERVEEQHARGKLTARERLDILLDSGSFVETDRFVTHQSHNFDMQKQKALGDGVVTGYGKLDDRQVFVYAHDFTVLGGSVGESFAEKVCKVMDHAVKVGCPIVGLNDSGGARIQEGVVGLGGFAEIFYRNVMASGVVPQISVILGPCAGGAVYSPALTDFVIMVDKESYMFITGPNVVKSTLNETVSFDDLGGAAVHSQITGVSHFLAPDEQTALDLVRQLLSYLPANNLEDPPVIETGDSADRLVDGLTSIVPADPYQPYDMRGLITRVVDVSTFLEVHAHWAQNIIVGFARLNGESVGVVANQPLHSAGSLDANASVKAARFIRFCDAFCIPIVSLVDIPGFLPGIEQEHLGIVRHGAKLLYAYCDATVPKLTVIIRKAYGGAYAALGSKHIRTDFNFAWPSAEIAVMGPEAAVEILYRKEIGAASDPSSLRRKLTSEYRELFSNPYIAAERGYIDDVIEPNQTRVRLIQALEASRNKREFKPPRKHGNIPL